jgi:hypothetical protein
VAAGKRWRFRLAMRFASELRRGLSGEAFAIIPGESGDAVTLLLF